MAPARSLGRSTEPVMVSKILWAVLALLRIVWCLLPQISYLHPDEFFQSPEVMAGDILGLQVHRPWEFLSSSPCRTAVFPLITSGATFWMMKSLTHWGFLGNSINSYTLLVLPRLCLTFFSFILDYSVYWAAPLWAADQWKAMVLLAGSYVTLVYYTRTFNNAIEGLLFALLLMLVSSSAAINSKTGKSLVSKAKHSSLIGIILAGGCFNRPTFIAFASMPVLYWALENTDSLFNPLKVTMKLLKLVPSATFTALIFIVTDTVYFTQEALVDYLSFEKINRFIGLLACTSQNIVLTPFNFLRYNLNPDNLAQHGTHPQFTHFVVNGIMLFGILHVSAAIAGGKVLTRALHWLVWRKHSQDVAPTESSLPESHTVLLLFYFVPLAVLSLFPHQEPRFLIPLIVPLVLWSAPQKKAIRWKSIIISFNLLGALVFGCLHQGGLIPSLSHLEQVIHTKGSLTHPSHYTMLFTHTYMPPKYLLNITDQDTSVEVIDIAGTEKKLLCQTLGEFVRNVANRNSEITENRMHHFYVIIPGTVKPALEKCGLFFKNETLFFPHLTMEDPPQISALFSDNWMSHLGLYIFQLEIHGSVI